MAIICVCSYKLRPGWQLRTIRLDVIGCPLRRAVARLGDSCIYIYRPPRVKSYHYIYAGSIIRSIILLLNHQRLYHVKI